MASNLKLKNVVVDSNDNNSDYEDEKVAKNLDFYFSLEKLNLGPKKKLLVLNLGGLLVDRVHRRNESTVRRYTPDLSHGNFLGSYILCVFIFIVSHLIFNNRIHNFIIFDLVLFLIML